MLRLLLPALAILSIAAPGLAEAKKNIVLILADDAGYGDFGFMGSDVIRTPHIDALAERGVVFSNAYATTPFCAPSRAGLLTGRYPQRFGFEFNLTHQPFKGTDPETIGLDTDERTVGDYLQEAGYRTIVVGKWHVGDKEKHHPNRRGFDEFYGFLGGGNSYDPERIRPGNPIMRNSDVVQPKEYLTDDFAREAASYIEAATAADAPFFLYLAFNAVHTPLDVLEEDMAAYAELEDPLLQRRAAMTRALDRAVGRVDDAIREAGIAEETIVIFTNDNGGDVIGIGADNTPLRGTKGTLLEGGIRVPLIVADPDAPQQGVTLDAPVSLMDLAAYAIETAGGESPENIDGVSFDLSGKSGAERALFWRYDVAAAMRQGPWKLIRFPDRPAELYNLDRDPGEERDLARRHPRRVEEMMAELFAWEAGLAHPRWHTGPFWTQEDIRRYADDHIQREMQKSRDALLQD